jgi:hypothetical protein
MKELLLIHFLALLIGYSNNRFQKIFTPPPVFTHSYEPLENEKRLSSFPFISGDTYRALAQVYVDELRLPVDTSKLKNGDIIFVKNGLISYFFNVLRPQMRTHYILVCANSDYSCPGKFFNKLNNDDKMLAWFTTNIDVAFTHSKLFPIPLGIANRYRSSGNIDFLQDFINKSGNYNKDILLYFNMNLATKPSVRNEVYEIFVSKSFCYQGMRKPWREYLIDLASSKFVLSPHGNGLDCYRTWEALLLGCIPIVKTSTLDPLYTDLPVIIVKDWHEVTEDFLNTKWQEMQHTTYNKEKMFAGYWLNQIKKCQQDFLQS